VQPHDPIFVNDVEFGDILRISKNAFWEADKMGQIPAPYVFAGSQKRWRMVDVLDWVRDGCPDRETWAANHPDLEPKAKASYRPNGGHGAD
jgi:hypothetical protein